MSAKELRQLGITLDNLLQQRKASAAKKSKSATTGASDPVRDELDARTQGYLLNPRVILREMRRPNSPFMVDLRGDKTKSEFSLRGIARQISDDLFREVRVTAKQRGWQTFDVTGKKFPPDFVNNGKNIVIAFDKRSKIIFFKGTTAQKGVSNHYRSFTEQLLKPTIDRVKDRQDALDPTRVFVSPDHRLLAAWNKIADTQREELLEQGLEREAVTNRIGRAKKKFFQEKGGSPWQGLDFGHVFGSKASTVAGFLENRHDVAHQDVDEIKLLSVIPASIRPQLEDIIKQVIRLDTDLHWERLFRKNDVRGKLTYIIPESFVNNRSTGGKLGPIQQRQLRPIADFLRQELPTLKGSPSHEELLVKYITDLFLNKPVNRRVYKTRVKNRTTSKRSISVVGITAPGIKIKQSKVKSKEKKPQTSNEIARKIINPLLHDKIKENMGKGGSKAMLNYRTGRFARSAKVTSLFSINERNAIGAKVKYRKNPYQVFEPEGPLHKPGRDPHRIFSRSIRKYYKKKE